eukprot:811504-Rhodomonas_salina.1
MHSARHSEHEATCRSRVIHLKRHERLCTAPVISLSRRSDLLALLVFRDAVVLPRSQQRGTPAEAQQPGRFLTFPGWREPGPL